MQIYNHSRLFKNKIAFIMFIYMYHELLLEDAVYLAKPIKIYKLSVNTIFEICKVMW